MSDEFRNPFRPTFGSPPPRFVGREAIRWSFAQGLDDGPGSPARATLYVGARGVGKTAMLNEAEREAELRGWIVIRETARAGLVDSLMRARIPEAFAALDGRPSGPARRITGVDTPFGGVSFDSTTNDPEISPDLRSMIEQLEQIASTGDTGVLLSIDELHAAATEEIREIAIAIQHTFRRQLNVAFVGAGLPAGLDAILDDDIITFLRRADRHDLGPIDLTLVDEGLRDPAAKAGRPFDDDALRLATAATEGFAFMIQLVGFHCINVDRTSPTITVADARIGIDAARHRVDSLVHEPEFRGLTDRERAFVFAMVDDADETAMAAIRERTGLDMNNTNTHRHRLIRKGVIRPVRKGYVAFANAGFRTYLGNRKLN